LARLPQPLSSPQRFGTVQKKKQKRHAFGNYLRIVPLAENKLEDKSQAQAEL
jgi:hypothetical protein